ncbi:heme anaerobic degradation radical SAM methyltransferase ChuW/HutW [Vibrio sp. SM6]|uniref:Heme anaerobic degradation radical SAM methyltransferase ChuW/HutW n=1 Tax=Vibrio agarilyticus TaxID=2726741 RepID=A0A7X8YGT5_9VIBR|nr:heme anaerobic degradation radical SAM methyltransferase ChuW/HutW [Vibrio agarilyticus]
MDLDNVDVVGRHTPDPLRYAFQRKRGAHAGGSGMMSRAISDTDAIQSTLNTVHNTTDIYVNSNPSRNTRCLYIHIPFCRVRCTYCNFFQYASSRNLIEQYVEALIKEIRFKATSAWVKSGRFHAVYFGGGTPTDLSPEQIARVVTAVRDSFPLTPDCEITLEGRVNRFSDEKFSSALDAGINRFSFGVQSFDTQVRRSAKRLDDRKPVLERLQQLSSYNAAPIVIDLLYGLPYQDLSVWQRDLEDYLSCGAQGVDLYQLIEMQGLPMARMVEQGKLPMPADTPTKASMFEMGVKFMAKHHQKRLSVNHWASDNRERSLYNSLAKTSAEVMPLGAGAGGNLGGWQMMQVRDMETYIKMVDQNLYPVTFLMPTPSNQPIASIIKSGFDAGVLHAKRLNAATSTNIFSQVTPLFKAWQQNGLAILERNEQGLDYLSLTLAGQFWSVTLAQILIETVSGIHPQPKNTDFSKTNNPDVAA